jgi:2,4-dienoyl-CoA reductase-like NADH-dependent reductase (Old Yellow Enzyme family)
MAKGTQKESHLKNLLRPIKIGPVELRHRMVLAPMNETLSVGEHGGHLWHSARVTVCLGPQSISLS